MQRGRIGGRRRRHSRRTPLPRRSVTECAGSLKVATGDPAPPRATSRQRSASRNASGACRKRCKLLDEARFMSVPSTGRPATTHVPERDTRCETGDMRCPAPPRTTSPARTQKTALPLGRCQQGGTRRRVPPLRVVDQHGRGRELTASPSSPRVKCRGAAVLLHSHSSDAVRRGPDCVGHREATNGGL